MRLAQWFIALACLWFPMKSFNLYVHEVSRIIPLLTKSNTQKQSTCGIKSLYSFFPAGLADHLVMPGSNFSTALDSWVHKQQTCIPAGTDAIHEQSLNAHILLKNHLVDFIVVCHLDALLIRVQQGLSSKDWKQRNALGLLLQLTGRLKPKDFA